MPSPEATISTPSPEATVTPVSTPSPTPPPTSPAPSEPVETPEPTTADTGQQSGRWTLSFDGFGPIVMSEVVPGDLQGQFDEDWECIGPVLSHPEHGAVEVWSDDGSITTPVTAIILPDDTAMTSENIRVGMTLAQVEAAYPDLARSAKPGQNDTIEVYAVDGGRLGLYFEVVNGVVAAISLQPSAAFWPASDRSCGGP